MAKIAKLNWFLGNHLQCIQFCFTRGQWHRLLLSSQWHTRNPFPTIESVWSKRCIREWMQNWMSCIAGPIIKFSYSGDGDLKHVPTSSNRNRNKERMAASVPWLGFADFQLHWDTLSGRCEKAPCTDLRSDPTLQQNSYRTTQADAYVNHAHQTSAARVVTNLIKLKHCRVKKTVSPSTPTCWRQAPSFRSRRNTISHRETKQNKQTTKTKHKKGNRKMCSLCWSVLCQVMWHSSSCSLNELLTPVLRADVSTGKLDSRFPVNKPQVLQIKVCWNDSSCYKSTKLTFH